MGQEEDLAGVGVTWKPLQRDRPLAGLHGLAQNAAAKMVVTPCHSRGEVATGIQTLLH